MKTLYRVFLYSSDVGRLTFEADHPTEDKAKAVVQNWIGDKDWDEELAAGSFRIDTILNGHIKGTYSAYAHAYTVEKDSENRGHQLISEGGFKTFECAQLAIDRAVDEFALNMDSRLYARIQREQRAAGINERFITDLAPFGFRVYTGEDDRFQYDESVTIEDLENLVFPPDGMTVAKSKQFEVKSGALRVTDPCYNMETWCAGTTENVLNGIWHAHVGKYTEPTDNYRQKRFDKDIADLKEPDKRMLAIWGVKELSPDETDQAVIDKHNEQVKRANAGLLQMRMSDFARTWGLPDNWPGRVAYLHIRHESVLNEPIDEMVFEKNDKVHVGVDSGQAGFFDLAAFEAVAQLPDHGADKIPDHPHAAFYEACGSKTLGREAWGVVYNMGAVSLTGYGDGGYTLCERRNEAGELIEARIVYMLEGSEMFPGIGGDEEDDD
ncbi:hypothetical protein hairong_115 [Pseudomonas phage hairong]|nr:hypothetical protein hairong_115 [Pseudomonas phage hairong]